jgi:hypothetical protein
MKSSNDERFEDLLVITVQQQCTFRKLSCFSVGLSCACGGYTVGLMMCCYGVA